MLMRIFVSILLVQSRVRTLLTSFAEAVYDIVLCRCFSVIWWLRLRIFLSCASAVQYGHVVAWTRHQELFSWSPWHPRWFEHVHVRFLCSTFRLRQELDVCTLVETWRWVVEAGATLFHSSLWMGISLPLVWNCILKSFQSSLYVWRTQLFGWWWPFLSWCQSLLRLSCSRPAARWDWRIRFGGQSLLLLLLLSALISLFVLPPLLLLLW